MASSVETFLINPLRCQDSKRDQCGKKRRKPFLAGSLSMADWLWTWYPFLTHPYIHPLCKVALQLLSSRGGVPTSWTWASLFVYGQQNEVEGTLCQFSRPHPQEACVLLWLLYLCHESMPRLACWMESHEQSCVSPAVAGDASHIREQKQDQQTLLVDQLLTSPDHQNRPEGCVKKNTSYCTSLRCCVGLLPSIFVVIHN